MSVGSPVLTAPLGFDPVGIEPVVIGDEDSLEAVAVVGETDDEADDDDDVPLVSDERSDPRFCAADSSSPALNGSAATDDATVFRSASENCWSEAVGFGFGFAFHT